MNEISKNIINILDKMYKKYENENGTVFYINEDKKYVASIWKNFIRINKNGMDSIIMLVLDKLGKKFDYKTNVEENRIDFKNGKWVLYDDKIKQIIDEYDSLYYAGLKFIEETLVNKNTVRDAVNEYNSILYNFKDCKEIVTTTNDSEYSKRLEIKLMFNKKSKKDTFEKMEMISVLENLFKVYGIDYNILYDDGSNIMIYANDVCLKNIGSFWKINDGDVKTINDAFVCFIASSIKNIEIKSNMISDFLKNTNKNNSVKKKR